MTFAALIIAMSSPTIAAVNVGTVDGNDLAMTMFLGGIAGGVMGAVIGMFHLHQLAGFLIGLGTGATLGTYLGAIVIAPDPSTWIAICLGGSVLLVVMGGIIRISARRNDL